MIDRLIARVLETRNAAHLAHWATSSDPVHRALGEFYEGILGKLDDIVEVYQGAKGVLVSTNYQPLKVPAGDAAMLAHIKAEADWIAANRAEIAAGVPSVLNMLDDLHGVYAKAAYKLKFLA